MKLKQLRENLGFTQQQVAHKLCVSSQIISNIERGIAPIPPKFIKRMAPFYGVTAESMASFQVAKIKARYYKKAGVRC